MTTSDSWMSDLEALAKLTRRVRFRRKPWIEARRVAWNRDFRIFHLQIDAASSSRQCRADKRRVCTGKSRPTRTPPDPDGVRSVARSLQYLYTSFDFPT